MTTEPTITCPNCKAEIKLTESLAAPLIESTKLAEAQKAQAELIRKERELADAKREGEG